MKYYSEILKELYDTEDALVAAEAVQKEKESRKAIAKAAAQKRLDEYIASLRDIKERADKLFDEEADIVSALADFLGDSEVRRYKLTIPKEDVYFLSHLLP